MSATAKVEEYIRAESRLSSFDKPEQLEEETKAQYCWRLIRSCVKQATDLLSKADIRDIVIGHGVHHSRRLNHTEHINEMLYNKHTKEYLTVDSKVIRIFKPDGRKKDIITPEEPINRLLFAAQINLFVGWNFEEEKMQLMDSNFEVLSTSKAAAPILAAIYNENINEVVTVGPGCITSWVFRYGGRHLLPRKTTRQGLTPEDRFTFLALEDTASRSQKCFAAHGTGVAVFNVYEGQLMSYEKELHTRHITALCFFNPLKYLVTGAKDGSIKVWDEKWHLQLVFVGHSGMVSCLAVYPYGPLIMSSSFDCTLRVWSLETCDEVDKVDTTEPLEQMGTALNQDNFFSFCAKHADLWKVKHIHTLHTTIGHKVMKMKATDHPSYPIRMVLLCRDASIRILSPETGDVITTGLNDPKRRLIDAAYAIAEDTMFAVFHNGDIMKCNTAVNPCETVDEWPCKDVSKACNYLLVYEYVISAEISSDIWTGMKRAITTKAMGGKTSNRTLLLGGRKDGYICVFNWETGEVEFEIEAHGSKGVLSMVANSKSDQLISAGLDNIIKVWRLYPYAQESLAPLSSFYCAHTPVHMTVMRDKLFVAFQEHLTATYSVVLYNLENNNRSDHGPEDDHTDSITGLSGCAKLRLFASCSVDGTIKIWNENNHIVRLIRINAVPHSISFCSQKGDLVVGIGEHLHKIDYKCYMPKTYRFKMVSMRFPEPKFEKSLPFDENLMNQLSREDQKRLKAARSSFKFTHFMDILTEEETEEVMKEKKAKEKAFSILEDRENELCKIRDGELKSHRKPKQTKNTKRDAFDKYLKIFYSRPELDLYMPHEPFIDDKVREIMEGRPTKMVQPDKYSPEKEPTGFFPAPSTAKRIGDTPESPLDESPTINADGYVPNSVLVRLLWPPSVMMGKRQKDDDGYRPPELSEDQLNQIASVQKKRRPISVTQSKRSLVSAQSQRSELSIVLSTPQPEIQTLEHDETEEEPGPIADSPVAKPAPKKKKRSSVIYLDYEDEALPAPEQEEEAEEEELDVEDKPPSSLMQKFQEIMDKSPTPPPEPEVVEELAAVTPEVASYSPVASEKKVKPFAKRPTKPIVKFISRPPPPPPKVPTPPPRVQRVKTPSPPPRPVTPLPDFILQFKGTEWFDKYFPNCNERTLPKPWTVDAFVAMVVRLLRIADFRLKVDIADALKLLQEHEGISNSDGVIKTTYSMLNHHSTPPSCMDEHQKAFIISALKLLQVFGNFNREFYAELMVQFLEADKDVRKLVMDIIKACGMRDPHGFFPKELDSWDTWNIDEDSRKMDLRRMCNQWLDKWLTSFKLHVKDSIERLKKGQGVHGHIDRPEGRRASQAAPARGILKKPAVDVIEEGEEEEMEGVQYSKASSQSPPVTVTFEAPPDVALLENATYIEAINYFCEMELEKQLDRMRRGSSMVASPNAKNTVLVLPKLTAKGALVRLGETHTSRCRPHRETSLAVDFRLPPVTARGHQPIPGQLRGFAPAINLPMKTLYMNPFPGPTDAYEPWNQQPILLTLKSSQKYFIPGQSYVQDYY